MQQPLLTCSTKKRWISYDSFMDMAQNSLKYKLDTITN